MAKRWRLFFIGFILAIALHVGVSAEQPHFGAVHEAPSSATPLRSQSTLIDSADLIAPLTWSSSPHVRALTLHPGVSTHAFAVARIAQTKTLTLAVLIPDSQRDQIALWQPTADYLTEKIPDYSFSVVGMNTDTLRDAVAQNAVDFIVSESGFYAAVESDYTVNRLVTRRTLIHEQSYTMFGSVVFCLKHRDDIKTLANLADQRFVGVSENSLEGWQIAWRELDHHGIDPYTDLDSLRFVEDEAAVVAAVMAGEADAGVIRADAMEHLVEDGMIRWSDLTILNQQQQPDFPLPISTRLYPEWPFAALNHVPDQVVQQVAIALLSMNPTDAAAHNLHIAGWSIPVTYQPVNDLLRQLRIGPYRLNSSIETFNLRAVLWHYKRWIFTITVLLVLGTTTIYVQRREITKRKRSEAKLYRSQAELTQRKGELEQTLTTLQNTQTQLIQTEKMSSLGELMAGIAHEINNPVNFIHGNINYANRYVNEILTLLEAYQIAYPAPTPTICDLEKGIDIEFVADDLPKLLKSMQVGSERIREIVQSLRIFSRLDEAELKAVDIHPGIESTLMILQNRLKAKPDRPAIQVIKSYGMLPLVECHAGQLNQVFMNILGNAIDALDEQNLRHIRQGNIHENGACPIPTIWVTTESLDAGWVCIRLKNNGPSIPSAVQQKLFNPFFTTKPIGKGTGLGMSISYQIVVEKHGGRLKCVSEPEDGVEFIIEIPVKGKQSVKRPEPPPQRVQV